MRVGRRSLRLLTISGALAFAGASLAAAERPAGLFGGPAQTARNRRAALPDASRLLAGLRLPSGASLQRVVPRSKLSELEAAKNHADAGEIWTVAGTIGSVISYLSAHPPSGSRVFGGGSSGRRGEPGYSRGLFFGWPAVGDVLNDRTLDVSVSAGRPGQVSVDAQAESIWLSARPSGERFPASTRSVTVAVDRARHAFKTLTISGQAKVKRIVALFNETPIVQHVAYNCPEMMPPLRQLTYLFRGPRGQSLAQVSYTIQIGSSPGPCNPMRVTIGGRHQDALLGGDQMVEVQRLIGIRTGA